MGDEQLTEEQIAEFKEAFSLFDVMSYGVSVARIRHYPTPHVFRASCEDLVDDLARGGEDVVH